MLSLIAAVMLAAAAPESSSAEAAGPAATLPNAEAAEEPPGAASKKKARDELACWDQTPVGTRFSKRVCATRGDLDERRRRDQDLVRTIRTAPTPSN